MTLKGVVGILLYKAPPFFTAYINRIPATSMSVDSYMLFLVW